MLPRDKDAALPHTDFNGGGSDTAACEVAESVEDQDKANFTDTDGKEEVSKPDELLRAALVAESTRTRRC